MPQTITKLGDGRYLVEGDAAWCEVTVDDHAERRVSSHCGTAWPTAWPELFEADPAGGVGLTPRGLELLGEAGRASAVEPAA